MHDPPRWITEILLAPRGLNAVYAEEPPCHEWRSVTRPLPVIAIRFDKPPRGSAEFELGGIVVHNGVQIGPPSGCESLDRLQRLNGQALSVFDSLLVEVIRLLGSHDSRFSVTDSLLPLRDLGVGFGDLAATRSSVATCRSWACLEAEAASHWAARSPKPRFRNSQ